MNKFIVLLTVALIFCTPLVGNANPIGTGNLDIDWSGPIGFGYYLDYDGTVTSSNFGYTTGMEEVFCVSFQEASSGVQQYSFYEINASLDVDFGAGTYASLSKAAWIADNWLDLAPAAYTQDQAKGEAQSAVWKVTGVMPSITLTGYALDLYSQADQTSGYLTNNWYFANNGNGFSPTAALNFGYQDYLTPNAPVPEPSSVVLLGLGLVGLAGYGFKRKK